MQEVQKLVNASHVEDWDIFKCINCSTDIYALHSIKGYDRVLVNTKLEVNIMNYIADIRSILVGVVHHVIWHVTSYDMGKHQVVYKTLK